MAGGTATHGSLESGYHLVSGLDAVGSSGINAAVHKAVAEAGGGEEAQRSLLQMLAGRPDAFEHEDLSALGQVGPMDRLMYCLVHCLVYR